MARDKFSVLTEQMFYILLCLKQERCGSEITQQCMQLTHGRIKIGPGTLYNLLDQFLKADIIKEIPSQSKKRNYILTDKGFELLASEYERIRIQTADYEKLILGKE